VAVFTALDAADPLPAEEGHDSPDPHFWQDAHRMAMVVRALVADLTGVVGPARGPEVAQRAEAEAQQLDALDGELAARYGALPEDRRVLVTDHDAFAYLAARYGFRIVGVVVPGGGTDGAPSAGQLADLARAVREAGIPAVFGENTVSARLPDALAHEVGGHVAVVALFSDALGDAGSGGATYAEALRTNAARITAALGA
jgi:zinc/manganese transport system substrate-binding protein